MFVSYCRRTVENRMLAFFALAWLNPAGTAKSMHFAFFATSLQPHGVFFRCSNRQCESGPSQARLAVIRALPENAAFSSTAKRGAATSPRNVAPAPRVHRSDAVTFPSTVP